MRKLILLFLLLFLSSATAQEASLLPNGKQTFVDANGNPLNGGRVYFYIPNSDTLKTTWTDPDKSVANSNPVVLDAAGRAVIYGDGQYRQVVKDRNGNQQWDQVTASPGTGGGSTGGDTLAVGSVLPWAALTPPTNYLFTYGQQISRTTYADLLAAITISTGVNCSNGSPTLTGVADTTQIPIGANIEVSCVASTSQTVASKTANTITLTGNANITTSVTAIFYPYGNGNGTTTFNLPDYRGVVLAGRPNMGGTAKGNLTTTYYGENPDALGANGGSQSSTLLKANLPTDPVTGTVAAPVITSRTISYPEGAGASHTYLIPSGGSTSTTAVTAAAPAFTGAAMGSGTPHSIIQPTLTINYIIKVQSGSDGGGVGTVTSVGLSMPGIFTVTGSPITSNGTLTVTALGTSGGIPYFNAANTMASSAALTANLPMIGGGAGSAPSVGTRSGNTTKFVTTTGTLTTGNCAQWDSSGNLIQSSGACTTGGTPGGNTGDIQFNTSGVFDGSSGFIFQISGSNAYAKLGTSSIGLYGKLGFENPFGEVISITTSSAATTYNFILPDGAGSAGQCFKSGGGGSANTWGACATVTAAALTKTDDTNVTLTLGGTPATALLQATSLTLGWSGQLSVPRGGTGAATFTANLPLIGNGTSAVAQGTRSGNTTSFATTNGTMTSGDCVSIDANGNLVAAGGACTTGGGGGTVNSGTAGQIGYYGTTGTTISGNPNITISSGAVTVGVAGSVVGSTSFANATSGTIKLQPTTGALGSSVLTLPAATGTVAYTVATGAKALATSAISSAACTSAQTDTATGTLTTDTIVATFNADPTAVTGYVPLTTGMLTIIAYPTSNTVNFKVCNNTGSSITPGAITLNWRVSR